MIRVLLNVPSPALRAGLRALLVADKTIRVVNDSLDDDDLRAEADVVITSASQVAFLENGSDPDLSTATLGCVERSRIIWLKRLGRSTQTGGGRSLFSIILHYIPPQRARSLIHYANFSP